MLSLSHDRSRRWLVRVGCAALLAALWAYVPWRIWKADGYARYRAMGSEVSELERANGELRQGNRELRREIRRLRHDLTAVAAVARDDLGMVRPGELVLQLAPEVLDAPGGARAPGSRAVMPPGARVNDPATAPSTTGPPSGPASTAAPAAPADPAPERTP